MFRILSWKYYYSGFSSVFSKFRCWITTFRIKQKLLLNIHTFYLKIDPNWDYVQPYWSTWQTHCSSWSSMVVNFIILSVFGYVWDHDSLGVSKKESHLVLTVTFDSRFCSRECCHWYCALCTAKGSEDLGSGKTITWCHRVSLYMSYSYLCHLQIPRTHCQSSREQCGE